MSQLKSPWIKAGALGLAWLSLAGCWRPSLESLYEQRLQEALAEHQAPAAAALQRADLTPLPEPLRRYLAFSGALGRPRPWNFRVRADAQMFSKPGAAPMPASSVQHNFLVEPTRLFFMRARMFGLPVQVFHAYAQASAQMRVRVAGLVDMVDLQGLELSQAETVTLLNDLCVFAPGSLVDPRLRWQALDPARCRVSFSNGPHTVGAELHFGPQGELVNFVSDDRSALVDGVLKRYRFSTPLRDYRDFNGLRLAAQGDAVYEYPEGPFVYGRFVLKSVEHDVAGIE